MAAFYGLALLVVLGAWFGVSVAFQFRPRKLAALRTYDYFSLMPVWTFFAPRPGTSDTHLLFRDRLLGIGLTPWRDIPVRRTPLRGFWNPHKRVAKTLRDLELHLLQLQAAKLKREQVCLSMPYLVLINYIAALPRANFSASTQFAVARSWGHYGRAEPDIVFLSEFHEVNNANDFVGHRIP
jgi:hypothetical protein